MKNHNIPVGKVLRIRKVIAQVPLGQVLFVL